MCTSWYPISPKERVEREHPTIASVQQHFEGCRHTCALPGLYLCQYEREREIYATYTAAHPHISTPHTHLAPAHPISTHASAPIMYIRTPKKKTQLHPPFPCRRASRPPKEYPKPACPIRSSEHVFNISNMSTSAFCNCCGKRRQSSKGRGKEVRAREAEITFSANGERAWTSFRTHFTVSVATADMREYCAREKKER